MDHLGQQLQQHIFAIACLVNRFGTYSAMLESIMSSNSYSSRIETMRSKQEMSTRSIGEQSMHAFRQSDNDLRSIEKTPNPIG